jgi:hypothetical protein
MLAFTVPAMIFFTLARRESFIFPMVQLAPLTATFVPLASALRALAHANLHQPLALLGPTQAPLPLAWRAQRESLRQLSVALLRATIAQLATSARLLPLVAPRRALRAPLATALREQHLAASLQARVPRGHTQAPLRPALFARQERTTQVHTTNVLNVNKESITLTRAVLLPQVASSVRQERTICILAAPLLQRACRARRALPISKRAEFLPFLWAMAARATPARGRSANIAPWVLAPAASMKLLALLALTPAPLLPALHALRAHTTLK